MENLLFQLAVFVVLFSVSFAFGRYNERKHLAELEVNEARLAYITTDNQRMLTSDQEG